MATVFDTSYDNSVTIHQQPNDAADAARLLSELQDEATQRITGIITTTLKPSTLEVTLFKSQQNLVENGYEYFVAFRLNNAPHQIKIKHSTYESFKAGDQMGLIEEYIMPRISQALLTEVFKHCPNGMGLARAYP